MSTRRNVLFGALAIAAGSAALAASAPEASAKSLNSTTLVQPNVSSSFRSNYLGLGIGTTSPRFDPTPEPFVKDEGPTWVNYPHHIGQGPVLTNPETGTNVLQSYQRNLLRR